MRPNYRLSALETVRAVSTRPAAPLQGLRASFSRPLGSPGSGASGLHRGKTLGQGTELRTLSPPCEQVTRPLGSGSDHVGHSGLHATRDLLAGTWYLGPQPA